MTTLVVIISYSKGGNVNKPCPWARAIINIKVMIIIFLEVALMIEIIACIPEDKLAGVLVFHLNYKEHFC